MRFPIKFLRLVFRHAPWFAGFVTRFAPFSVYHAAREEDFSEPMLLKKYQEFPVVRAWWTDGALQNLSTETRASTRFFRFQHVYLSPSRRGGFLVAGKNMLFPESGSPGTPKVHFQNAEIGGIVAQEGNQILAIDPGNVLELDRAVFTGSMAPHNWFHWTIDNLATMFQAKYLPPEFEDFPLIVPETVIGRPHWVEAMELVKNDRQTVVVGADAWIRVTDLVRVENVTWPNPRALHKTQKARIGALAGPVWDYKDHLLSVFGLENLSSKRGRRVFLARRQTAARPYNQDQLFEIARKRGFEKIFLEDLSLRDSILVFREAEAIVGPHGAGWANLIFARPETKAVLWTWRGELEDNWYENIAFLTQVRYQQLQVDVGSASTRDMRSSPYFLDPILLEKALDRAHI